ncbi:spore-associated protein A [Umezawaea sp. Da 62-37]|uniref:spore-associated protein A n=1 Tax=Umezawaea sp. Da 62-37 TaxID=3075927 RepID=UPI0028F74DDA|nr:spore-associated protein A [Umezawaea sp. Da 62-37]WNV84395.1 spore-associated protein A [Umezawaea sp. Da 62-37]
MTPTKAASAAITIGGLLLGTALLAPGVASAATYNGMCGSGYSVVNSRAVVGGTVFLTYNASTGYNCVVTVRNSPGAKLPMGARVSRSSDPGWVYDNGDYTTYAGPVYRSAPGECVDWGGGINGSDIDVYGTNCSR